MKEIFKKEYIGFESLYDLSRDVDECFDPQFNENAKELPGEFQGTVTVTITYKETP